MRRMRTTSGVLAAILVVVMISGNQASAATTSERQTKKSTTPKATTKKPSPARTFAPGRPDPESLPSIDEEIPASAAQQQAVVTSPARAPAVAPAEPLVQQPPTPLAPQHLQMTIPLAPAAPAEARKIGIGKAAVLGIVEGLTEYLPVSSTGHLILVSYWLGLSHETNEPGAFGGRKIESSPAVDSFEIVIQLGAILAVLGIYRKRVGQMARGVAGRSPNGLRLALLLLVAFLPAAVFGLALHKKIEQHLFGPMPVVIALAVGGVLMIVVEHLFWTRKKSRIHAAIQTRALTPVGATRSDSTGPMVNLKTVQPGSARFTKVDTMLFWQAAVIGFAQCLAMWPGTSRSMVTILAALVVGLDMVAAAEFSFLLALPTLGAATLFSAMKHWDALMQATGIGGLLVGLIVSGIVAALAVNWFVHFLTRRGLLPFGVYRIVIALVLMLYFLG